MAVSFLILAGCGAEQSTETPRVADSVAAAIETTTFAPVEHAQPVAGEPRSLMQASSPVLMATLAPSQRELVENFYARYGSMFFSFSGEDQLQWLIANGYPLPEDVLDAAGVSAEELLERYRKGDAKAGFFYLDRATQELASGPTEPQREMELDRIARDYLAVGSPLAGYAYYRYQAVGRKDVHAALAGLVFAGDLGDSRAALQMMDQAARRPGDVDAIRLLNAYQIINTTVRSKRPELLMRQWPSIPAAERPGEP